MEPIRGAVALALLLTSVPTARAAEPSRAPLDAEMLRDLDVLGSPTYSRDRELSRRLPLIERFRVLETLRQAETESPPVPATVPGAPPSSSPSPARPIPPSPPIPPSASPSSSKEGK